MKTVPLIDMNLKGNVQEVEVIKETETQDAGPEVEAEIEKEVTETGIEEIGIEIEEIETGIGLIFSLLLESYVILDIEEADQDQDQDLIQGAENTRRVIKEINQEKEGKKEMERTMYRHNTKKGKSKGKENQDFYEYIKWFTKKFIVVAIFEAFE